MKPLEHYIQTVLSILCLVLTFKVWMRSYFVSIRLEPLQQFFHILIYSSFNKKRNLNFLSILLGVKKLKLCPQPPFLFLNEEKSRRL